MPGAPGGRAAGLIQAPTLAGIKQICSENIYCALGYVFDAKMDGRGGLISRPIRSIALCCCDRMVTLDPVCHKHHTQRMVPPRPS